FQVHLEDPYDPHVIGSDIEVLDAATLEIVWVVSVRHAPSHVRSTDGVFIGSLSGSDRLLPGHGYLMRARFVSEESVSAYNETAFTTTGEITYADVPVDWVLAPGYALDTIATDLSFPVAIRPAPDIYAGSDTPKLYIAHLYGWISVLTHSGEVYTFASDLLNYEAFDSLPGAGETGVTGLWVDDDGTVWATMSYREGDTLLGKLVRFDPSEDGLSAVSQEDILVGVPSASAHQIQMVTRGPDGKLYVNTGDADNTVTPQDWYALEGKVLRINDDGSIPDDNPVAGSPVWAAGLRNPFGANWYNGSLWITNTGTDRYDGIYKVDGGETFGWCCDTDAGTWHSWFRTVTPTQLEFDTGRSGFPESSEGSLYVVTSGPTYSYGPDPYGKRIVRFTPGEPFWDIEDFVVYTGRGTGAPLGMAFLDDGLYFTDLYGDGIDAFGVSSGVLYRVRYVGDVELEDDVFLSMNEWFPKGLSVSLSCTTDGDGLYSYRYDLGNGHVETIYLGDFVYHVYDAPGEYEASCMVNNLVSGARKSASLVYTLTADGTPPSPDPPDDPVDPEPPVDPPVDPEPPEPPEDPDLQVSLSMNEWFPQGNAVAVSCVSNAASASYAYDFGDGYVETIFDVSFVYYVYPAEGAYTITCTVTSDDATAMDSLDVVIGGPSDPLPPDDPPADPEPPEDPEPPVDPPEDPVPPGELAVELRMGEWFPQGLAVALECSSDAHEATYEYDFGDGYVETITTDSFVYYVYPETGTYEATCTVDDGDGTTSRSLTFTLV
ncbi:MAG: PKD domain-containing protein, partial [Candidatus Woesearchaeota archaeon]